MVSIGLKVSPLRNFLLYSNTHIPFIVLVLIGSSSVLLGIEFSIALATSSCCGAFLIYQIDRIWLASPEDLINQPDRVLWYKNHKKYVHLSSFFSVIMGGIALLFVKSTTLFYSLLLGFLGLLYLLPIGNSFTRLKGNLMVKPMWIACSWSYGVVVLPVIESGDNVDYGIGVFLAYRGLLIVANVLLADLPDTEGDEKAHLASLAVLWSKKRLGYTVTGISSASLLVGVIYGVLDGWPFLFFVDLGGALVMIILAQLVICKDVSASHFILGYLNDLIIAWPIVSIITYKLCYSTM